MNIRMNVSLKIFIILLSISQILIFVSCSNPDSLDGHGVNSNINESIGDDLSSSAESTEIIKSGTLRLWMPPPDTLNPLVSIQYQWNQLSHLFFESLFDIDSRQRLNADLVNDYTLSDDGLAYTITLKEKVLFHDNTTFDSQDVLSTIQFIQNQNNKSIYFDQTKHIASVTIVDTKTLLIRLIRPDPFFLYDLTFPIMSSDAINNSDITFLQPGTGLYKMTSYEKGKQLNAVLFNQNRNSEGFRIKSIRIFELNDTRAAMEAFGDDKVDIVSLRDSYYDSYYLRNDMRFIRYPGNKYIFFEMNQNEGKLLSNAEKADYIRSLISESNLLEGIENIFISKSQMPVLSTSPLIHQSQCNDILTVGKKLNPFRSSDKMLKIIYPQNDMLKSLLITQLSVILDLQGVRYTAEGFDPAKFNNAVISGEYDLALREATLNSNPDPSWLYLQTSLRPLKDIDTINKTGSAAFTQTQTILQQMYLMPKLAINAESLCGIMNKLSRCGPFIGLGFRINGIILSKRIKGQIDSNSFNQYNDLKDVWVWSGQ